MKQILARIVLLLVISGSTWTWLLADDHSGHSLEISMNYTLPYRDTMLTNANTIGTAYAPMITYSYRLNENNEIAIHLIRFTHFYSTSQPVYLFSYGFGFKHLLPKRFLDLGIFVPYFTYGILLTQGLIDGASGRGIAHNTRIGLGTELILSENHRLFVDADWESFDFPSFDSATSRGISAFTFGVGWKILF